MIKFCVIFQTWCVIKLGGMNAINLQTLNALYKWTMFDPNVPDRIHYTYVYLYVEIYCSDVILRESCDVKNDKEKDEYIGMVEKRAMVTLVKYTKAITWQLEAGRKHMPKSPRVRKGA